MLFRVLHILSILTGPNIFVSICLSKMRRLFSSFAVNVQVSDQYVTTGLIIFLYIFISVFFVRNFDFISFALALVLHLLPFAILSAISIFILLSAFKMHLYLHHLNVMLRTTQFTMEKTNSRASCTSTGKSAIRLTNTVKYGYRVFPVGKERPGRDTDPSPLLMPWSRKSTAIPLLPPMGRTACTEPQCLYKGALYSTVK